MSDSGIDVQTHDQPTQIQPPSFKRGRKIPTSRPIRPKPNQRRFRQRGPKKAANEAAKALIASLADANAQIAAGFRPVSDPGSFKFRDPVNGEIDLSYDPEDKCPVPTCTSQNCHAHRADLSLNFDSDDSSEEDDSDSDSSDESEDGEEVLPIAQVAVLKAFSKRIPGQFPFWPVFVLCSFLLLLPPLLQRFCTLALTIPSNTIISRLAVRFVLKLHAAGLIHTWSTTLSGLSHLISGAVSGGSLNSETSDSSRS